MTHIILPKPTNTQPNFTNNPYTTTTTTTEPNKLVKLSSTPPTLIHLPYDHPDLIRLRDQVKLLAPTVLSAHFHNSGRALRVMISDTVTLNITEHSQKAYLVYNISTYRDHKIYSRNPETQTALSDNEVIQIIKQHIALESI
jgi:hypothetical protein